MITLTLVIVHNRYSISTANHNFWHGRRECYDCGMSYKKDTTEAVIDGILKFLSIGGVLTAGVLAPNSIAIFGKPLDKLLNKFDKRQRERELRRVLHYMKQRGLVSYKPRDYENGIILTDAGRKRIEKSTYANLSIPAPKKWDKKWRIVFFDIPEAQSSKRKALTQKLRLIGYRQLQLSIWIHPFPSRAEIEAIAERNNIRRYLTYVEVESIDGEASLLKLFDNLLKQS